MSIDAMKMALEDLQKIEIIRTEYFELLFNAKKVLRAAIEAAEKQEPVAWMGEYNINDIRDHYTVVMRHKTDFSSMPGRVRPLYTTPQPAIPEDWQLVPVEMSDETNIALGDKYGYPPYGWKATYKRILAMLAAAPKPENSHD